MDQRLTPNDALNQVQRAFESQISDAVKSLLESKHLYQSITLEFSDLLDTFLQRVESQFQGTVKSGAFTLVRANWSSIDKDNSRHIFPSENAQPTIRFQTPDVKLFCQTCDRIEAFNSLSSEDFLQRQALVDFFSLSGHTVQVWVFSFLCQACKSVPEVFLVRRQGLKLTNSGRSPIEQVNVPPVIPKSVRSFYSGAVVAYQSGQTLAGIFLLRTLMEQWVRSVAASTDLLADEALVAYMGTLPEDFKSRFPSLRSLYADLSSDMHAAKGSPGLFEKARSEIVEHFDARRLFRL
jgi:hypothetical protein